MRFPGFIGPSYTSQSKNIDCERTVNMFLELHPLNTGKEREVAALVLTPGLRRLLTLAESPLRALYRASNDQVFAVAGDKFYRISSAWVETELGTLNTDSGPVSIADNGLHLVIVDGTDGYTWTIASSTFAEITDPDFFIADQVTFQDGYFICNKAGSQQFFISGLNDITWDALDIGAAEGYPDNIVAVISVAQQLFLFGTQSTEVFYNSGAADFPFERIQGAVFDIGCAAAFSVQKMAGFVYFIGGDTTGSGRVYRVQGGAQPVPISTPALEATIRGLTPTQLADSTAWAYQQGGHLFYCLNLPGTKSTWVFDASTELWHERTYLDLWEDERHRAQVHCVGHGLNIVGDYENGNIYELDPDYYKDDIDADSSTSIARIRVTPHFSSGLKFLRFNSIQIDMEVGVGLDGTTHGTAPLAMLSWSDDGGHSFSNERTAEIGAIGKRKTRVKFNRLGSSRDRVFKLRITDPVPVYIMGAEIDVEEGVA